MLAARVARKEAAVRKREEAAAARLADRARRTAAGQATGGTRPITSTDQDREVRRSRKALARARAAWEAAAARAAAPAPAPDARVNATDPSSRVMPLKKGGYDQLHNVQALATARTLVILAIMRHPSPNDTRALAPLMAMAPAGPGRRRHHRPDPPGPVQRRLRQRRQLHPAPPAELYIAVTREARQTGRSDHGRDPAAMPPSWQDMAARLDTEEGRKLYKKRGATIEPVFAQLTARLGRTLNHRGDHADAELALWAASHNALKAISARARNATRQARATAAPAAA